MFKNKNQLRSASYFADAKKAKEIEEFFKNNPYIGLERTIAQVTEQIRANSEWISRDRIQISSFFKKLKNSL